MTLVDSSILYTQTGRHDDALAADREAVTLYRRLHAAQPAEFCTARVNALRNLVIDLRNLDLTHEAEQTEREVATLIDDSP